MGNCEAKKECKANHKSRGEVCDNRGSCTKSSRFKNHIHIPLDSLRKLILNIFLCCLLLEYNSREEFNQKSVDDTHDYGAEEDKHFLPRYIKPIESHG
jgi:hypothetical protein